MIPERKCIDPEQVRQSKGRVTCPDVMFNAFKEINCAGCPKQRGYNSKSQFTLRREVYYFGHDRR